MSEIIIERLLEQRDMYLNILKQIDFQISFDGDDLDIKKTEILKNNTIEQIKNVEKEIAYLSSKKES